MALQSVPGAPFVSLGFTRAAQGLTNVTLDAANEALIFIGQVFTSDAGSHTIDTTGSSSLGYRLATTLTFANAGTTLKVGLATVDIGAGPPARATNVADVITFSVSKSLTGGGGGLSSNAWNTHTPSAGTLTVAHGDFIAFAIQMTARGGADVVTPVVMSRLHLLAQTGPHATTFLGGAYANLSGVPNAMITFSDGALGYFIGGDAAAQVTTTAVGSGSSPNEYGQLFSLPFPVKVYGIEGFAILSADTDVVLYSDPLGTPVAEKTYSSDGNTVSQSGTASPFAFMFTAPYTVLANASFVTALKPGASTITVYHKTISAASHRIVDVWGTSGYGVTRSSGAFANKNSSLDHVYIAPLLGAFDDGAGAGGGHIASRQQLGM